MRLRGFELISTYKDKDIIIPTRKTQCSAGYDIAAAEDIIVPPNSLSLVPTGIKAYMQPDEYLGIHIRSGLSIKNKLSLMNSQGIIDADYYNNSENEGHIFIAIYNHNLQEIVINKGARIAQGIFYKYLLTDIDDHDIFSIRKGGLGSTGN
ncbi:dUTP diphosphatase [Pelosinus sp. IPA-1]|uniref:dUTP diphosphatase n=1 Tax=Pelosinus sp. IPA-1 TaxID=3029569 RepID=UPI0024361F05|nr:dUTP diphosphatase [Pelosinus sp. IPA-1]GMA99392.1 deoxyuridine 5'-triphosphate nucleotidohydrolase [Pelosinus sp. IPA-1]